MIRGLSAYHLGQLLNFDKLENSIMAYAGDACTVSLKESGIIVPWPVIYILTAFHRKHIFLRSPFPHIGSIRNSLELFRRRMLWNWRFLEDENPKPVINVRTKGYVEQFSFKLVFVG